MTQLAYEYVVLRCVPRVEREEFVNVGVLVHCQAAAFLEVAWSVDADRMESLFPRLDVEQVRRALDFIEGVCAGDERGGAASHKPLSTRFGFLKAPRSTVIQPGPVHGGITTDPARQLDRLLEQLVH